MYKTQSIYLNYRLVQINADSTLNTIATVNLNAY